MSIKQTYHALQKVQARPHCLFIKRDCVKTVTTFRFLGTHISGDLSWTHHIKALVKKAQQWLHFLLILRKHNLDKKLLLAPYYSSVERKHTYCLGVWYIGSTAEDRNSAQRVINTVQRIIRCPLVSLDDLSRSCWLRKTRTITRDPSHPAYHLFDQLPSGWRFRSIKSHTSRLTNSFFHTECT